MMEEQSLTLHVVYHGIEAYLDVRSTRLMKKKVDCRDKPQAEQWPVDHKFLATKEDLAPVFQVGSRGRRDGWGNGAAGVVRLSRVHRVSGLL